MAIYAYFMVDDNGVSLVMPQSLYNRVSKLATYLRMTRCNIFSLACSRYGVSVEAVEKYLDHDRKEDMRIAENFEL